MNDINITLNHSLIRRVSPEDLQTLFFLKNGKKVNKLSSFMEQAIELSHRQDIQDKWNDDENGFGFRGDAFELFTEAFLKLFGLAPQIGVCGYEPWNHLEPTRNDYGIDGIGYSCVDGTKVGVQAKHREDVKRYLNANRDHLSNFTSKCETENIPKDKKNRVVFTNGNDINPNLINELWGGHIRAFGGKEIDKFLFFKDKNGNKVPNVAFWDKFCFLALGKQHLT